MKIIAGVILTLTPHVSNRVVTKAFDINVNRVRFIQRIILLGHLKRDLPLFTAKRAPILFL